MISLKNNRSKGVNLIGLAIILLAVLQFQQNLVIPGLLQVAKALFPEGSLDFFFMINMSFLLFELILGFGLLALKEWSRRGVLVLAAVYTVSVIVLFFSLNKNYLDLMRDAARPWQALTGDLKSRFNQRGYAFDQDIKQASGSQVLVLKDQKRSDEMRYYFATGGINFILALNTLIMVLRFFMWYFLVYIFLTQPKVVEQFNQKVIDVK